MSGNESIVTTYLNEVSANIAYGRATKKQILKGLRGMVEDYMAESPDCELADLYAEFGEPASIAHALANKEEYRALVARGKRRTRTLIILCAVLGVVAVAAIVLIGVLLFELGGTVEITNVH